MNAPPHPADFLNEVLMPATGRSDGEIARLLGISLPVFYTILTREKPISQATAIMLGRLFNTGEEFWLKMQADYDRFVGPQTVVDDRVMPVDGPSRSAALGQGAQQWRQLPKPTVTTYVGEADEPVTSFGATDVVPWRQEIEVSRRSSIG